MRSQRAYHPDKLGLGGKELQEAMEDYLKSNDYTTWMVRAREIIRWFEAYYSIEDDRLLFMDTMLYAMEANVVPPWIEEIPK